MTFSAQPEGRNTIKDCEGAELLSLEWPSALADPIYSNKNRDLTWHNPDAIDLVHRPPFLTLFSVPPRLRGEILIFLVVR